MKERQIKAAEVYMSRGWKVFTVSDEKRPWKNCEDCGPGAHDGEDCTCLFCHGFQAAVLDVGKVVQMLDRRGGQLAVRTGQASGGLVVIDAEAHDAVEHGRTGVEVLDAIEDYIPGVTLADTLKAQTASGGLHLFYTVGKGAGVVASRNRVLPSVDVKADGGYVCVPPAEGRTWLNWRSRDGSVTTLEAEDPLRVWLRGARAGGGTGSGTGSGGGGAKARLVDGMVPMGERYAFTRDLVYKLRKRGVSWEDAVEICQTWYARYEQPPAGVPAVKGMWYLPWRQMEYELERAWARVDPGTTLSLQQLAWVKRQEQGNGNV